MSFTYRYEIGDHSGGPELPLEPLAQPTLNFYRTGQAHDVTMTIDGRSEAGATLQEKVQDVWAWRVNSAGVNELMFRGPFIGRADVIDENSHTVTITANSYRSRLAGWPIPYNPPGSTTSLHALGTATPVGIGWLAINLTAPNSDLAAILVDKHTASGSSTTQSAEGGTPTDAAIDSVAATFGFDWDLIPNATTGQVEYRTWAPSRGIAHPEYELRVAVPGTGGGNCTLTRSFDLSSFGNEVWYTGQDASGNPLHATAPTTRAYGPEGLWIATAASTTNTTGATTNANLQAQANAALLKAETPSPAYVLAVNEGWWPGMSLMWLGDSPQLVIKSGSLNVNRAMQIEQITIAPWDGAENVQISLGAKDPGAHGEHALARGLAAMTRQLQALQWQR